MLRLPNIIKWVRIIVVQKALNLLAEERNPHPLPNKSMLAVKANALKSLTNRAVMKIHAWVHDQVVGANTLKSHHQIPKSL